MSSKVPHCSGCNYLRDRGYGYYGRRLCTHPDYRNPIYADLKKLHMRIVPSDNAATSPRWCPLRKEVTGDE